MSVKVESNIDAKASLLEAIRELLHKNHATACKDLAIMILKLIETMGSDD